MYPAHAYHGKKSSWGSRPEHGEWSELATSARCVVASEVMWVQGRREESRYLDRGYPPIRHLQGPRCLLLLSSPLLHVFQFGWSRRILFSSPVLPECEYVRALVSSSSTAATVATCTLLLVPASMSPSHSGYPQSCSPTGH